MRRRKSDIQKLKEKLDELIQKKYVPLNPKCLVCGGKTSEMHHFIQKSQSTYLRWDERNLIPLCKSCHCKHHVSGDPEIVEAILRAKGFDWADEIGIDRRKILKVNKTILNQMIDDLKCNT